MTVIICEDKSGKNEMPRIETARHENIGRVYYEPIDGLHIITMETGEMVELPKNCSVRVEAK